MGFTSEGNSWYSLLDTHSIIMVIDTKKGNPCSEKSHLKEPIKMLVFLFWSFLHSKGKFPFFFMTVTLVAAESFP